MKLRTIVWSSERQRRILGATVCPIAPTLMGGESIWFVTRRNVVLEKNSPKVLNGFGFLHKAVNRSVFLAENEGQYVGAQDIAVEFDEIRV